MADRKLPIYYTIGEAVKAKSCSACFYHTEGGCKVYLVCRGETVPGEERPAMWNKAHDMVIRSRMRMPTSEEIEKWQKTTTEWR